jgi:uncharacterized membrane protein YeaQ/YmgE (transglycosylase-associated protein family)
MTLIGLLLVLLVGAVCGAIAEFVVGYSPGGLIASAVVGLIGAWLGMVVAAALRLPGIFVVRIEGHPIEIAWTIIGAVLLLLAMMVFRRIRPYSSRPL